MKWKTICVSNRKVSDSIEYFTLLPCDGLMRTLRLAEAKGEKFKSSEGLEASEEEMKDAFEDADVDILDGAPSATTNAFEAS